MGIIKENDNVYLFCLPMIYMNSANKTKCCEEDAFDRENLPFIMPENVKNCIYFSVGEKKFNDQLRYKQILDDNAVIDEKYLNDVVLKRYISFIEEYSNGQLKGYTALKDKNLYIAQGDRAYLISVNGVEEIYSTKTAIEDGMILDCINDIFPNLKVQEKLIMFCNWYEKFKGFKCFPISLIDTKSMELKLINKEKNI